MINSVINPEQLGQKVKKCGGRRKITQAEFIERAEAVHGKDSFDYVKSVYKTGEVKVIIICPHHGEFSQAPRSHWNGAGCPTCSGTKKLNTTEFIKRAEVKHGTGTYDYSLVEYKNAQTKVTIICPRHDLKFRQAPYNHLNGVNCPQCALENHPKRRLTNFEFIARCQMIHGSKKYDYRLTEYTTKRNQVTITCLIHGDFEMEAAAHMKGSNCPACVGNKKLNTAEFIKKAKAVHGVGTYDYSLVKYENIHTKVIIGCNQCSETFEQKPHSHLYAHGCPDCNAISGWQRSDFEAACKKNNGQGFLYLIKCNGKGENFYKVGITSNTIKRRFNGPLAMPYNFEVLKIIEGRGAEVYDMETQIHQLLKAHHYTPCVFFGGSSNECFSQLTQGVKRLLEIE